jgi:hypothetical protein
MNLNERATSEALKACSDIGSQLQQLLNESTPEGHEAFFSNFCISNEQRKRFVEDTFSSLKAALSPNLTCTEAAAKLAPLPKLIHRLWLTNPTNPSLPPESYLKRIEKQTQRLGKSHSFVFWHNSERAASELHRHFPEAEVDFRHISSLDGDARLLERISLAIQHQKYVLAGDISKYLILKEVGGIYADLGVDFGATLVELVCGSDVSLFLDRGLFFQPAFMAAPANAMPFRIWCSLLSQPEVVSSIGLQNASKLTPGNEIWVHGGVGFTAALILFYDQSYRILAIPPNRGSLHHESQGSWYKSGNKYGNITLDSAPTTHLSWELHTRYVRLNEETQLKLIDFPGPSKTRINIRRHLNCLNWLK